MKIVNLALVPCDFPSHQVRFLCPHPSNMMSPTISFSPEVKYIKPLILDFAFQNYDLKKMLLSTIYLTYSVIATENKLTGTR